MNRDLLDFSDGVGQSGAGRPMGYPAQYTNLLGPNPLNPRPEMGGNQVPGNARSYQMMANEELSNLREVDQLTETLAHLRLEKAAPPPVMYQLEGGGNISEFFLAFEEFCGGKYPRARDSWSRILGSYLGGEVRRAFDAIDGMRQPYDVVKDRLQVFYDDKRRGRDEYIREFFGVIRTTGETLSVLALRLERLGGLAFPENTNRSREEMIRIKFMALLPEALRSQATVIEATNPNLTFAVLVKILNNLESDTRNVMGMAVTAVPPMMTNLSSGGIANSFSPNAHFPGANAAQSYAGFPQGPQAPLLPVGDFSGSYNMAATCQGTPGFGMGQNLPVTMVGALTNKAEKRPCGTCGKDNHGEENCFQKMKCSRCNKNGHLEANCWQKKNRTTCDFCGKPNHSEDECYQKSSVCYKCHRQGHFARDCENAVGGAAAPNFQTMSSVPNSCVVCGEKHLVKECPLFNRCPICHTGVHPLKDCTIFNSMLSLNK